MKKIVFILLIFSAYAYSAAPREARAIDFWKYDHLTPEVLKEIIIEGGLPDLKDIFTKLGPKIKNSTLAIVMREVINEQEELRQIGKGPTCQELQEALPQDLVNIVKQYIGPYERLVSPTWAELEDYVCRDVFEIIKDYVGSLARQKKMADEKFEKLKQSYKKLESLGEI